jgi:quercetin dioxygenase-like cupin family protein
MGEGHRGSTHQGRVAIAFVADITGATFHARRPSLGKAVLHEDAAVQMSVFRVAPHSGVPAHVHSRVHDLFVGVQGELEIRSTVGVFVLKPGTFCGIPPGTPHEVWNGSETNEAYFLLVHTPYRDFDFAE